MVGTLILLTAPFLFVLAREHTLAVPQLSAVTFDSDPRGATLVIDGVVRGRTPVTLELPQGRETRYRLLAPEPFRAYDLYRPYEGAITPLRSERSLLVWIDRTSEEEQQRQRLARTGESGTTADATAR